MVSSSSDAYPPAGTLVVALGGNAIARFGDDGTVEAQYRRAKEAMRAIADLACSEPGHRLVITHGNGPVVGNIVLRGEIAEGTVPPTPLYIAGADSEGGIGLMLQQVLGNELRHRGSGLIPATVVTQVIVDAADPAFTRPTKPIGPFYSAERARDLAAQLNWKLTEEPGRGWRRAVPSPRPVRVVEVPAVKALLESGIIPIAAGGGGVPVIEASDGSLAGVDAVVDKDWTAAVLAKALDARALIILMEVDALYERFGAPDAARIPRLTARTATELIPRLPAGTVGPKVAAAAWFAEQGGSTILCRVEDLEKALVGAAGTLIAGE